MQNKINPERNLLKFRKIKVNLLIHSTIIYRLFITFFEIIFLRILTGTWELAIKGSIIWNIINLGFYYIYHYSFAKVFKLGKE
ncbi:hypothetical protein LCGC14_2811350 [marine sediment metagenome]|uniref:DUF2061 domain-containing protein n=1 Tax=marine sediment metagenome TaxID=412755 RepID=A0A0F9BB40_9ZZZZ